jgi:DNA polymerase I-like protein with 3'-5' exonuclease and polymerase domains
MDPFSFLHEITRPKVEKEPWMEHVSMSLVTEDTLTSVIDKCILSGTYALDLEATGLDLRVFHGKTVTSIVGVCLAPSTTEGFYIPVRHKNFSGNIPISKMNEEMQRLANSPAKAVFHNALYDQELLQFNGGPAWGTWDDPSKWEDTLIMAYLENSKRKKKGLKTLSEDLLNQKMISLRSLFPEDHTGPLDYSTLDPTWDPVVWYAASDALCTLGLYEHYAPLIAKRESDGSTLRTPYMIEKMCAPSVRWMKRSRLKIDRKKAQELLRLGQVEFIDSIKDIYKAAHQLLGRDVAPGYIKVLFRDFNPDFSLQSQIKIAKERARLEFPDPVGAIRSTAVVTRNQIFLLNAKREDERYEWLKARLESRPLEKQKPSMIALVQTVVAFWEGRRRKRDAVELLSEYGIPHEGEGTYEAEYPMVYDVKSASQLGLLFQELNVPNLVRTESGTIKTSQDMVDKVVEDASDRFPWMSKVKRFREVEKALSSYILPILEDSCKEDDTLFIRYNPYRIDTGRFCTPGSKKPEEDGGTRLNMHGMPNSYNPKRPECMNRLREVFIAREGMLMLACDFSSVELRICANQSGEEKWVDAYFECSHCGTQYDRGDGSETPLAPPDYCVVCGRDDIGDLHTLTAISIFGDQREQLGKKWKHLRQKGKATNFSSAYGGGPSAIQRATNVTREEAVFIKDKFDDSYRTLNRWWDGQHEFVAKHGFVRTDFNRKCPLPDIHHENNAFVAKAQRNSTNAPIQGTSADITKIAMAVIYKECKKRGWLDKVHMLITFHDELVFEIDVSIFAEAYDMIIKCMTRNPAFLKKKWTVPLTAGGEAGYAYNAPWDVTKFLNGQPYKTDKEGNVTEDWPQILKDAFEGYVNPRKYAKPVSIPSRPMDKEDSSRVDIEVFEFELHEALSADMVVKIGDCIERSREGGTHTLRILLKDTRSVILDVENILINPQTFLEIYNEEI